MDVDLGQLREPCACGKAHNIDVGKISIESGAVRELTDILEAFQNRYLYVTAIRGRRRNRF